MEIRIHLPRPLITISVVIAVTLWWTGVISVHLPWSQTNDPSENVGGQSAVSLLTDAIHDVDRQRVTQEVLEKREEILRYQLTILENDALTMTSPEELKQLGETRALLLSIIKQRDQSEAFMKLSLEQLWDAEGSSFTMRSISVDTEFDWPVIPTLGISAFFKDKAYKKRFGFDHHAIDIPTPQGTPIRAPADGIVTKVSLNGLGYSSMVISHEDNVETIYGHITDATVREGDTVIFGQIVGRTGGRIGSLGAGTFTTGEHLHFAMRADGVLVDPMEYLPEKS